MRDAKPATWEGLLATLAPEVAAAARAAEAIVREELPAGDVRYDAGNLLLAFGWSMKMRDLLIALQPHPRWVNLQLADGVLLPDPTGIVEGTGKRIRHVKLRSAEAATSPAVRALVRAQVHARPQSG